MLKVWLLSVRVDLEWSRCAAASESTMKSCSIYSCASRFKNTSTVWWSRHTITQRLMKVSWITQNLWLPAPGGKYHEPLRPVGFFITYIRLGGSGLVLRHSSSDLDERMNRRMDGWTETSSGAWDTGSKVQILPQLRVCYHLLIRVILSRRWRKLLSNKLLQRQSTTSRTT